MGKAKGRARKGDESSDDEEHQRGAGSKGKGSSSTGKPRLSATTFVHMDIDPDRIRFAHSKIRPVFSGCGRSLQTTLEEIRSGATKITDLPVITVIEGPSEHGSSWYFSLNNRRLWVFKACKREGLLGGEGTVKVRVRGPKDHELERYTLERCSNTATLMREKSAALAAAADSEHTEESQVDAAAVTGT
ncbi:hypothetical protein JKP88DRAFT_300658 [Tribonema minus]|uniref:Uncharacterized protein n=1 Tax=Tribonema minus TaxID=303371 RepID=A0A835ZB41_9STRA|nr:hypothetical protein JKP88DRAFT_300658 [Tribonema minus]